jgi:hypothetical protein
VRAIETSSQQYILLLFNQFFKNLPKRRKEKNLTYQI